VTELHANGEGSDVAARRWRQM